MSLFQLMADCGLYQQPVAPESTPGPGAPSESLSSSMPFDINSIRSSRKDKMDRIHSADTRHMRDQVRHLQRQSAVR